MKIKMTAAVIFLALASTGCSNRAVVGTAVGAGAAGVGYEAYNKKRIEDNEDDFNDGKITREQFERRKDEIEDRSVVY